MAIEQARARHADDQENWVRDQDKNLLTRKSLQRPTK